MQVQQCMLVQTQYQRHTDGRHAIESECECCYLYWHAVLEMFLEEIYDIVTLHIVIS